MHCVPDAGYHAREVTGLEALSPAAQEMFGQNGIFSTLGWYRSTIDHALPGGAQAAFVTIARGEDLHAVFPMQRGPGEVFSSLSTPYTCLWQPLFATSSPVELLEIGKIVAASCRTSIRLDALDADAPWLPPLLDGFKAAGLASLRFDHFGNWHEDVAGLDWATYLAARPGALREAIRRRGKRLMEKMGARFSITSGADGLEAAIASYEKIYSASWKEPEPFADFNAAFMRACAADGSLRLGILSLNDKPLAAQFWVVRNKIGAVLKLAHDEASRALSPGTVLTALMIRHILEEARVDWLDFGRGDDDYKKDWTSARRQRIGVLLANPRSLQGGKAILRHVAGNVRRHYLGGVSR
jgi:CelD/BcsL family acetyltransferase involved in cellulose biosynthesis